MLNKEKALEYALVVVVVLCLAAAAWYGYFFTKPAKPTGSDSQQDPVLRIEELQRQAKAAPNNPNIQETLGNACYDQGDSLRNEGSVEEAKTYFRQAVEAYKKVQAIQPKAPVQVDMATALYYSDQPDEAEKAYKRAIELDPDYLNARLNYGIFLFNVRNEPDKAKEQLTKALELKPQTTVLQKISDVLRAIDTATGHVSGDGLDYTRDVEPVIFQNCTRCHGPGGVMDKSPLHTYEYVKKYVKPNDENSPLLKELRNATHSALQKPEIVNLIDNWIMAGAPGPK